MEIPNFHAQDWGSIGKDLHKTVAAGVIFAGSIG